MGQEAKKHSLYAVIAQTKLRLEKARPWLISAIMLFVLFMSFTVYPPLREYVARLTEDWELLLMSLGVFAFTGFLSFLPPVERTFELDKNKRTLGCVSFLAFWLFIAGFEAWKAEHDKFKSPVFGHLVQTHQVLSGDTYDVLPEDYLITVVTSPDKQTRIKLPRNPYNGERFEIKDAGGHAWELNIIVDGNGHTIDGGNTTPVYTNYGSITVTFDGTQWGNE
jgi:hypothetical protein